MLSPPPTRFAQWLLNAVPSTSPYRPLWGRFFFLHPVFFLRSLVLPGDCYMMVSLLSWWIDAWRGRAWQTAAGVHGKSWDKVCGDAYLSARGSDSSTLLPARLQKSPPTEEEQSPHLQRKSSLSLKEEEKEKEGEEEEVKKISARQKDKMKQKWRTSITT